MQAPRTKTTITEPGETLTQLTPPLIECFFFRKVNKAIYQQIGGFIDNKKQRNNGNEGCTKNFKNRR